jgi:hypothetical protein
LAAGLAGVPVAGEQRTGVFWQGGGVGAGDVVFIRERAGGDQDPPGVGGGAQLVVFGLAESELHPRDVSLTVMRNPTLIHHGQGATTHQLSQPRSGRLQRAIMAAGSDAYRI